MNCLFISFRACIVIFFLSPFFRNFSDANAADMATENYISKYRAIADLKSREYAIPYEVIMGIAIVESGAGHSRVSRELNNHFAIVGANELKRRSRFRQYTTAEASYDHLCKVIARKKFYETLRGKTDILPWVKLISQSGYSERPQVWRKRVLSTIEQNNL